jgi:hypothetical protein
MCCIIICAYVHIFIFSYFVYLNSSCAARMPCLDFHVYRDIFQIQISKLAVWLLCDADQVHIIVIRSHARPEIALRTYSYLQKMMVPSETVAGLFVYVAEEEFAVYEAVFGYMSSVLRKGAPGASGNVLKACYDVLATTVPAGVLLILAVDNLLGQVFCIVTATFRQNFMQEQHHSSQSWMTTLFSRSLRRASSSSHGFCGFAGPIRTCTSKVAHICFLLTRAATRCPTAPAISHSQMKACPSMHCVWHACNVVRI